jgi:hypothetical protein
VAGSILSDAFIDAMQKPSVNSQPGVGYGVGWEIKVTKVGRSRATVAGCPALPDGFV